MKWILIFIGGGLGSALRYSFFSLNKKDSFLQLPMGTILANFIACIAMGLILFLISKKYINPNIWSYLGLIGFCGGFSTFSTFSMESAMLIKSGMWWAVILNILVSLFSCITLLYFFTKNV